MFISYLDHDAFMHHALHVGPTGHPWMEGERGRERSMV